MLDCKEVNAVGCIDGPQRPWTLPWVHHAQGDRRTETGLLLQSTTHQHSTSVHCIDERHSYESSNAMSATDRESIRECDK